MHFHATRIDAFSLDKGHVNLADLVAALPGHRVLWLRTCDAGYDYSGGVWDRTAGPAEAHIEALVKKDAVAP